MEEGGGRRVDGAIDVMKILLLFWLLHFVDI